LIFSYKKEVDNQPKNVDIEYILWVTKEKVIKEELFSYPYNRKRLIYRRSENTISCDASKTHIIKIGNRINSCEECQLKDF
jgi:hypothetical protein